MKALCFVIVMLVSLHHVVAQYNKQNLKVETSLDDCRFANLHLYPVYANAAFVKEHKDLGKYLTLKEALEKKKIRITEVSGGEVNKLFIENISKDTVMILSGEVVQGGKQDRMLAQDVMLRPGSGKQDVDVFCVEHGRWQPRRGDMSFASYYAISSKEVRKAGAVKKDQQEVWDKVSETTVKNQAVTSSGTLTALDKSETYNEDIKKYTQHFASLFISEPDVIGVIAVSGKEVMGCDLFASHELFAKYYPDLLNSYATEAITSGGPVTVQPEAVVKYLETITGDEKKQEQEVLKNGTMLKNKDKKLHMSTF
jgi:hypothetical protein